MGKKIKGKAQIGAKKERIPRNEKIKCSVKMSLSRKNIIVN